MTAEPSAGDSASREPIAADPAAGLQADSGGRSDAHEPEEEVWTGRAHWKHFTGVLALWVVASLAVLGLTVMLARRVEWLGFRGGAWIVCLFVLLTGAEVVGRRVLLTVLSCRYRLTTQRLFIERGLLSQTVDQTELIRVDDVRVYKRFSDRLFGLGTVAVLSTDATDRETRVEGIRDPEFVAEAIRNRMRTLRRKSLFIENL